MNSHYFIYLTTNLINNKKYIGYHKGKENDSYLGSGVNLKKAIDKYGQENFKREILEFCKNKQDAFEKEKKWIKFYNAVEDDNFYNLSEGGENDAGWKQVQKWIEQNPEQAALLYQQNYERLKKWRKEHPEEVKKQTEKFLNAAHKWQKEHSEEFQQHIEKLQEARKKWQEEHPEEHQVQIDKWRQAGSIANSQKILCVTTGEIFESQSAAARYYGIPQGNISKAIKGQRISAGRHPITGEKLIWKLIDNKK